MIGAFQAGVTGVSRGESLLAELTAYWTLDEASNSLPAYDRVNGLTLEKSPHNANVITTNQKLYPRCRESISTMAVYSSWFASQHAELDTTGPFTFSCWYRPTQASYSSAPIHVASNGNNLLWLANINASQWFITARRYDITLFDFTIGSTDNVVRRATLTFPSLNNWHFICARYTGNSLIFQVDENENRLALPVGHVIPTTTNKFSLGTGNGNQTHPGTAYGYLSAAGFWKRALSDAEVLRLWNSGNGLKYEDFS